MKYDCTDGMCGALDCDRCCPATKRCTACGEFVEHLALVGRAGLCSDCYAEWLDEHIDREAVE